MSPPMRMKVKNNLVEKLIGSDGKAELLMFFHEHPNTNDSIDSIATRLKRDPRELEKDVEDLVDLGIIREVRTVSFDKEKDMEIQREISRRLISADKSKDYQVANGRSRTGVKILDVLLPDGYPSSCSVLVMGDPASAKTSLIEQVVSQALARGKNVIYATLDDFPDSVRASLKSMGVDAQDFETGGRKSLVFIDCYSFLVGLKSEEGYSEDPQRLSDLSIVITKALSEWADASTILLVIDSVTTLIQRTGVRPALDFLHTLVAKIRSSRASFVGSLSRKAFHPAVIAAMQDKVDGVIEMKAEDTEKGITGFIRVSKMRGTRHVTAWTSYERDPGSGQIAPSKIAALEA